MKKRIFLLMLGLLLMMLGAAAADTALDITEDCTITLTGRSSVKSLMDKKYTSYAESKKAKNPALTVESKTPVHGLYLCFQQMPEEYEIRVREGEDWVTLTAGDTRFLHAYYPLEGVSSVQVYAAGDAKQIMGFNEVFVLGEGEVPEWVQRWNPTPEKSDILFVVTRPEEELLYLGGAIPYYAVGKKAEVAVACLTWGNTTRRSELLNGLWSMGYRNYPVIGGFAIKNAKSIKASYNAAGEDAVLGWLSGVIRSCKPEVIVGPDPEGEGGNGQRMMLADACTRCFELAGQGEGGWQAQKLYLHLTGNESTQVVFDWTTPLEELGGRSGEALAYYAYQYHKTQDDTEKSVYVQGRKYPNNRFGLVKSLVGDDANHNDFLENIAADRLTGAAEGPEIYSWKPEEIPGYTELSFNEKGFLNEGEFIWSDDAHGHYVYVSETVKVVINRKFDGGLPLTWFESEVWVDTEKGELLQNVEYTPEKAVGKKSRVDAALNATENHLVFAVNSDYYTYRIGSKNGRPIGLEIRNGEIYIEDRYDVLEEKFFPNLDTMAFYLDGHADVHHSVDLSGKEYLEQGAYMVFSFGPYLIKDGQFSSWVQDPTRSTAKNPRHCIGEIEPGHYMDIMCEGRLGSRSEGVTMTQLAVLAQAAGCREACNMDGGQTAVVIFMGQQLNKIGKYDGKTNARATCEVLAAGVSDQVGVWQIQ